MTISFKIPLTECPYVNRNLIEEARTSLPPDIFKQEYLAELRDKKAVKFQQKRIYAQKIVKGPRIAISGLK